MDLSAPSSAAPARSPTPPRTAAIAAGVAVKRVTSDLELTRADGSGLSPDIASRVAQAVSLIQASGRAKQYAYYARHCSSPVFVVEAKKQLKDNLEKDDELMNLWGRLAVDPTGYAELHASVADQLIEKEAAALQALKTDNAVLGRVKELIKQKMEDDYCECIQQLLPGTKYESPSLSTVTLCSHDAGRLRCFPSFCRLSLQSARTSRRSRHQSSTSGLPRAPAVLLTSRARPWPCGARKATSQ